MCLLYCSWEQRRLTVMDFQTVLEELTDISVKRCVPHCLTSAGCTGTDSHCGTVAAGQCMLYAVHLSKMRRVSYSPRSIVFHSEYKIVLYVEVVGRPMPSCMAHHISTRLVPALPRSYSLSRMLGRLPRAVASVLAEVLGPSLVALEA